FFQAEDGIRDYKVTGVQTCALPIFDVEQLQAGEARLRRLEPNLSCHVRGPQSASQREWKDLHQSGVTLAIGRGGDVEQAGCPEEIGRASCRERVWSWEGAG